MMRGVYFSCKYHCIGAVVTLQLNGVHILAVAGDKGIMGATDRGKQSGVGRGTGYGYGRIANVQKQPLTSIPWISVR